jgi:Mn-containing catalase
MFYHKKRLQYFTKPDSPDPVYAKQLQELIGGPFGEMSVMMQYLFQGWNCRGPAKYKILWLKVLWAA